MKRLIKKILFIALAIFLANFAGQFFQGFLMGIGGNIKLIGLSNVAFDPLITIAYLMLFYFITLFYQPHPKSQYLLFLLTLFLSFTVNFIQGSILLVVLYFLLSKFQLL